MAADKQHLLIVRWTRKFGEQIYACLVPLEPLDGVRDALESTVNFGTVDSTFHLVGGS